ncbi:Serine/threonine protein kinase [Nonomuraea solani]|uniref:non-specific serine/threonine protein kinase n=1 Tax=Nonomuraea solani TaxID=1144553 RepID=A0A1H5UYE5_9ACTN|nr:protein kinase [Nonomuraea solani]SEF80026.1 Serine/threonine protein kinase [Nonomuraea solani]
MTVITERVRGYRLLERAGQDGPWAVHLARADAGGAEVLVKTLACHQVDKRALKRIIRGFGFPDELAAHEGVIPVLEVGATGDGRPFLVTPLHEGLTLAERPGRSLPMPLEQAMGLLRAVARALAATHGAGGVHGRVKPENVVMTGTGVMLTGFAMSALMSIVELPDGTLPSPHASPEELEGHPPQPASDVYGLASMAYELLVGRPAFALDGPGSTARFVLGVLTENPPPFPPTVPADLAQALTQAMSKDPAARPTATDLTTALTSLSSSTTGPAHPIATTTGPGHPPTATSGSGRPLTGTTGPGRPPTATGPDHPFADHLADPGPSPAARPSTTGPSRPPTATGPGQPAAGHPATATTGAGHPTTGTTGPGRPPTASGPDHPFAGHLADSGLPSGGRVSATGSGPEQSLASRLAVVGPGRPATARPPVTELGQPLGAVPEGDGTGAERSGPRELVWTVDPDRSQVRPPAGPQPFLPPSTNAAVPQAPVDAQGGRNRRVPLLIAGAAGLAVLVGVGGVALAMSGRLQEPLSQQPVAATAGAPAEAQPDGTADGGSDAGSNGTSDGVPTVAPSQGDGRLPADQNPADQNPADQTPAEQPDQAQSEPSAGPATSPPPLQRTADPAVVAAYRPKSLKVVSDNGTTVTLSWKAVRKSDYPVVIQQAPGDRLMSATTGGGNSYTIGNLNPATGYCFKVGSVVSLGQPSSVAWSSALCIRGAAEAGGGQDEEVQPPIVLPLATPPPS